MKKRHSTRKFKPKEITKAQEKKILSAINSAPSAGNLQSYSVFLVKEREKKRLLAEACTNQGFISSAPIVLVFFADSEKASATYGARGTSLYAIQDATIAAAYAQIAATAIGLSSCWVGAFDEARVQKLFNIERNLKPVAVIPIGFAAEKPTATSRRPINETVREDTTAWF
ncbi:MAG TPA: nitroreductase family protein [archaeon]|nr:nitroreductase family protein [archaeon]